MEIKSKSYICFDDYMKNHPEIEDVREEAKILQKYEDDLFSIIINHCG